MICNVLAAEFTSRSRTRPATLTLNRIIDGRRTFVTEFAVANRREARALANTYHAKPWNF